MPDTGINWPLAWTAEYDGTLTQGGATWVASTAYVLGNFVKPVTLNGYHYKCTTAGTSAATEPTWPTVVGNTVVDGTVTWTCTDDDTDTSAAIDLDVKASIEISIDADYSNHAKATGGLFVYILRDINGTDYESEADGPWGFEMDFLQAGTRRRTFVLSGIDFSRFKIFLDWDNSTASSAVTVATKYQKSSIPVASA